MKPINLYSFMVFSALYISLFGSVAGADQVPGGLPDSGGTSALCSDGNALSCPAGYVDGCSIVDPNGELATFYHACVPEGTTVGGIACELQVEAVCKDTEQDACSFSPEISKYHLCVLQ